LPNFPQQRRFLLSKEYTHPGKIASGILQGGEASEKCEGLPGKTGMKADAPRQPLSIGCIRVDFSKATPADVLKTMIHLLDVVPRVKPVQEHKSTARGIVFDPKPHFLCIS
jgi:hypothetical protein